MKIDLDLIQENSIETNANVKMLLETLPQQNSPSTTTEPEYFVGTKEAQQFLDKYVGGFSKSQFDKLAAKGKLPVYKFGENKDNTGNRYKISELKEWADNRMVSPTNNTDEAVNSIAESARKKQNK